jgi:hypothetical protein
VLILKSGFLKLIQLSFLVSIMGCGGPARAPFVAGDHSDRQEITDSLQLGEIAWRAALSENTVGSYLEFIKEHLHSTHASDALDSIEHSMMISEWEKTTSQDDYLSYRSFVEKYPDCEYASDAKDKMLTKVAQEWSTATAANSLIAYEKFLMLCPDSEHARDAHIALEAIVDSKEINRIRKVVRENNGRKEVPVVGFFETLDKAHFAFKDDSHEYYKLYTDRRVEYRDGIDIPLLRQMKPLEALVFFMPIDDFTDKASDDLRNLHFKVDETFGPTTLGYQGLKWIGVSEYLSEVDVDNSSYIDLVRAIVLGARASGESLALRLDSLQGIDKYCAIQTLALLNPKSAATTLVDNLDDESEMVRAAAYESLLRLGPRTTEFLEKGLASDNPVISARCATLLNHFDATRTYSSVTMLRYLLQLSNDKPLNPSEYARSWRGFLNFLNSYEGRMAFHRLQALTIPFLLARIDDRVFGDEVSAFIKGLDPNVIIEPLTTLLPHAGPSAIEMLGELGHPSTLMPLVDCLNECDCVAAKASLSAMRVLLRKLERTAGYSTDMRAKSSAQTALDSAISDPVIAKLMRAIKRFENISYDCGFRLSGYSVALVIGNLIPDPVTRLKRVKECSPEVFAYFIDQFRSFSGDASSILRELGWRGSTFQDEYTSRVIAQDRDWMNSNWSQAKTMLRADIKRGSSVAIFTAISVGNEELVPALISALNEHGGLRGIQGFSIATAYLNCGQADLERAAKDWARRNNLKVEKVRSSVAPKAKWGE